MQEPEIDNIEVDGDVVRASVRIVRCCTECGKELKEAALEMEHGLPTEFVEEHAEHDLEAEGTAEPIEESGGRYKKSYFGADVSFTISYDGKEVYSGQMEDKVAASEMEELT